MKKYDIKTTDTETLKKWYHLMVLGRALDEKAPSYLLQSLGWSYHAPYAGHDGIQLAVGQVFTKGEDFLFPYYRDMLTVLSAGTQHNVVPDECRFTIDIRTNEYYTNEEVFEFLGTKLKSEVEDVICPTTLLNPNGI